MATYVSATFVLAVAACRVAAALILVQKPDGLPPSNARLAAGSEAGNPAGCLPHLKGLALESLGGVFPASEFENMLTTRTAPIWYRGEKNLYLSKMLKVPWCPKPLGGSPFKAEDSEGFSYLKQQLADFDKTKPLVVVALQLHDVKGDFRMMQVSNFLCGLQRLQALQDAAVFALSNETALLLQRQFHGIRTLWHPGIMATIQRLGNRTNVQIANRIAKLVLAAMLVEQGHEVIISDVDMFWSINPARYLRSLITPNGAQVEFAAMKDNCWLELNSGFLYYRPTENVKELLRMALGTVKWSAVIDGDEARMVADNDQYLLNCALAYAAVKGLNYMVVPSGKFHFGPPGHCRLPGDPEPQAPLVWHTAGFTGKYEREMETFAALGMLDLEPSSGRCISTPRGSIQEIARLASSWSSACLMGPDGLAAALTCIGDCSAEPTKAVDLLARYKTSWPLPPSNVTHFRIAAFKSPEDVSELSDSDGPVQEAE